jgi:Rhs element Vgr protein
MAQMRDLSKAQLAFQVTGRDIDEFLVIRFRGTEGLCQLYRFEIDLASTQEGTLLGPIVGKPAVLSVNTDTGERWFHGIISRFEMTGETVGQTYFRAELVPAVWLLTHRYSSRIFQNKNVKEIITEVLTQGGIPSDRFDLSRLAGNYETREYCVQYRETDYNFISRLMEEESIWWYFEQSQDKHVLVLAEKKADYAPITGDASLPHRPPTGMKVEEEHVYRFRIAQSVRPGAVVINDYNFENPKLDLESKADNARDPGLVFSDFPGKHLSQNRGAALAKNHALEFETNRVTGLGQSNCKRLGPGKTFNLAEHPSAGFNGSYLVTQVTHQGKESIARTTTGGDGGSAILDGRVHQSLIAARGNDNPAIRELAEALLQIASRFRAGDPTANRSLTQWVYHAGQVSKDLPSTAVASGGSPLDWLAIPNLIADLAQTSVVDFDAPVYDCHFECIPASVAYVPARVTPWPVMRGTQTARVVGPDGEEIQVDKYGRVRVQFDWDLQGSEAGQAKRFGSDSSCWIRVCQGWAGGQYGIMFIPRVGQEVIVDFLEGDPDKPIIIGRVFNADHMPPYELPKEKTKSVIKTRSSKGGGGTNEIRFEDLKDKEQLFIQAQRQMDLRVKASHFHTVGGSYHVIVGAEKDGELSGGYLQLVHKEKRTHVKDYREMWVEGDEQYFVDTNQYIFVEGNHLRVVQGNIRIESMGRSIQASAYSVDADTIKLQATAGIELVCGASSIVLAPAGIYINGPMVYINSGAGPAQPAAPNVPSPPTTEADPSPADISQPGRDTRYTGPGQPPPELPPQPEVPGHEFPPDQPPTPKKSWIEVQVTDDSGDPVAGERVDLTLPNGQVRQTRTDSNGLLRVDRIEAGQCQISLPQRDADAWENA